MPLQIRDYPNQLHSINQSINRLFAHNTSNDETTLTSRRDEQDSQAPGALMAALVKHTKFRKTVEKQVQMSKMKAIRWPATEQQNNTMEEIKKPLRMQKNPHP